MATKAPTLKELETRPCTPEELQAALIKAIKLINKKDARIADLMRSGCIKSTQEAQMTAVYGL